MSNTGTSTETLPAEIDPSKINSIDPIPAPDLAAIIKKAMAKDMGARQGKEVALEMGMDPGLFSRYSSPTSDATIPTGKVKRWTYRVGLNLIMDLAAECGFDLVRRHAHASEAPLVPSVARVASEAGVTLSACLEALGDGVIDPTERASIHAVTQRLLMEVQALHDATSPALEAAQ